MDRELFIFLCGRKVDGAKNLRMLAETLKDDGEKFDGRSD